jgi:hypothetical protein
MKLDRSASDHERTRAEMMNRPQAFPRGADPRLEHFEAAPPSWAASKPEWIGIRKARELRRLERS